MCVYATDKTEDEEDINKLYGFGEPNFFKVIAAFVKDLFGGRIAVEWHHEASARFGWNCNARGEIWLWAYSYARGVRTMRKICRVEADTEVNTEIYCAPGSYYFITPQALVVTTPRQSTGSRAFGFGLFPYFGGDNAAPNRMAIWLRRWRTPPNI